MEKICILCKKKFEVTGHGTSRKFCFECSPSYTKGDNSSRANTITCIRRALKKQLVNYKGGKCEKCGYDKCLRALQFHHLNPSEKDFTISSSIRLSEFDINKYYEEVDKCILVCANCHAEIHEKENKDG